MGVAEQMKARRHAGGAGDAPQAAAHAAVAGEPGPARVGEHQGAVGRAAGGGAVPVERFGGRRVEADGPRSGVGLGAGSADRQPGRNLVEVDAARSPGQRQGLRDTQPAVDEQGDQGRHQAEPGRPVVVLGGREERVGLGQWSAVSCAAGAGAGAPGATESTSRRPRS